MFVAEQSIGAGIPELAVQEPLAQPLGERSQGFEVILRQIDLIISRVDLEERMVLTVQRLAGFWIFEQLEHAICPVPLVGGILVVVHLDLERLSSRSVVNVLRQAGDRHVAGAVGDLAALVEEDARILVAEDLFYPFLVVQAPEPDLRAAGESCVQFTLVQVEVDALERLGHHRGEGVVHDGLLHMTEAKPQDGVAASRSLQGALDDLAHDQERLAAVVVQDPIGKVLLRHRDVKRIELLFGG